MGEAGDVLPFSVSENGIETSENGGGFVYIIRKATVHHPNSYASSPQNNKILRYK